MEIIKILKALGDEKRIRILNILKYSELCVGEIEYILEASQSNISKHLTTLKNVLIITYEKKAQWMYYRLNHEFIKNHLFVKEILEKELSEVDICIEDEERLKKYKNSGKTCADLKECRINKCKCKNQETI